MAGTIKGITIQIGADTTKLSSALNSANKSIKETQTNLKNVEKALKMDPSNINLLKDKQVLLNDKIADTKTKLEAMKQAQAKLDGSDVDKNSKEYKKLKTEIDLCESELKQLTKESKQFGSAGAQAIAAFGEKLKGVGEKISAVGQSLTTKLTLPIAAAGAAGVTKFAEVDKTMQLTNATMGNTAEQAELLNQAMKDAAANSTFGMNDAATATLNFARAGLTAEQAAAALAPAMNLAAGEGGNLDTVSAGLVATINGFGGSFDDAAKYADVFANACNNSALDVDSLSEAMSVAAPIFKTAGYSVEDAALYMGVMANAGIDANTAANSLKTGLARLVKPAKEGQVWMDKLGISVTNADGSMKDSITVQEELSKAFSTLSESEQIEAASAIFGKNQMANWLALINTAPSDVEALSKSLQTEGTTAKMASTMMSGFGGSLEKLKSSIDVAATSFGEALAPMISKVADASQRLVDWFNGLTNEQRELVAKIALVVAALGPLLLIVGKVITVIGTIMTMAPMLSTAFAALAGPIGIAVAAIAAVIAIGVTLYKHWDEIKEKAHEVGEKIKEKWENAKQAGSEKMTAMKENVAQKWDEIKNKIANSNMAKTVGTIWQAAEDTMQDKLDNIKKAYDDHGGGLKGAVSASIEAVKGYYTAGFTFVDKLTGGKLSDVLSTVKSKMSDVKAEVSERLENVKAHFNEKLSTAASTVSNKFNEIKNHVQTKMDDAKNNVSTKLENMKTFFTEKLSTAANTVSTKFTEIKNHVQTKMEDAKTNVSTKLENIKTFFSEKLATAAGTVSTKLTEIKNHFKEKMETAKTETSSRLDSINSFFSTKLKSIADTVSSKMSDVKEAFTGKVQEAFNVLSGIVQKIKDLFNITLKLDLKLPHVSVSGGEAPWGIGGKGTPPSFSVDWYDKGGIFNHPSIIGVGEKRPEFVGALDDLRQIVREEAGGNGTTELLAQMVDLLSQIVDRDATPITVNQTINAQDTSYAEQQKAAAYEFKQIARALS